MALDPEFGDSVAGFGGFPPPHVATGEPLTAGETDIPKALVADNPGLGTTGTEAVPADQLANLSLAGDNVSTDVTFTETGGDFDPNTAGVQATRLARKAAASRRAPKATEKSKPDSQGSGGSTGDATGQAGQSPDPGAPGAGTQALADAARGAGPGPDAGQSPDGGGSTPETATS